MQETTFNSPSQVSGNDDFASVHSWLDALYAEASHRNSLQKLDLTVLSKIHSLKNLESHLNYIFKNRELLITALRQSTFCYEFKELALISNERMEFLGDSLVNFMAGKILFKRYPTMSEGDLSKLRGSLVNEHSLAKLATSLSLGENLLLGKGEHKNHGQTKESLLADAFEALCAAVYFDSNEDVNALEKVFNRIVEKYEAQTKSDFFALENLEQFDSKTQLQEIVMAMYQTHPTYKSIEIKNGFHVELWIGEKKLAEAHGPSKKKLEKELARIVLDEKRYQ